MTPISLTKRLLPLLILLLLTACGGGGEPTTGPGAPPLPPASAAVSPTLSAPDQPASEPASGAPPYEISGVAPYLLDDKLVVLGAVRNTGRDNLPVFRSEMALLDSSGATVATAAGGNFIDVLPPGATAPLSFQFPAGVTCSDYRVTIDQSATLQQLAEGYYGDFDVDGVTQTWAANAVAGVAGQYAITGSVVNRGQAAADYAFVGFTVFDDAGRVVSVGSTSHNALNPGESATFSHSGLAVYADGAHRLVTVAVAKGRP